MTAKRTRKLRTWTRWAYVDPETGMAYVMEWWQGRNLTERFAKVCGGSVIRVLVSEIPKPSRKKVRRGK